MNTPMASDQKSLPVDSDAEAEISKLLKKEGPKPIENNNAELIRSSVARLTSNSIDELQGLISELQKMQEFLKSEVDSVQHQIESALAGINIIVETIGPWKSIAVSQAPPNGTPSVGGRPAANVDAAQSRRVAGAS